MKIEVIVFFNSTEDTALRELDIEPKTAIKDAEKRPVTFYSINNIARYYEEGGEYCCIASNGQEYITPLKYEVVKSLIESQ